MITAERYDDTIVVISDWNDKPLIKSVPGSKWNAQLKAWEYPCTWATCVGLRGVFGDRLVIGPALDEWSRKEYEDRIVPSMELRSKLKIEPGRFIDINDVFDERMYDFQKAGAHWLQWAEHALLADEMGTGKTIQTLSAIRTTEETLPALIICPNTVKENWAREISIWFPEATPFVIKGGAAGRLRILKQARATKDAIVIINFEALKTMSRLSGFGSIALKKCRACSPTGQESITATRCEVHPKPLNDFGFRTVVVDEAHRIKDAKAQQSRACWAVGHGDSVTWRLALTGTPLANNPGDLWSILHFLEPREFPTKSAFVDRYCLQNWNAWGTMDIAGVNPATKEELFKIIDPRLRRTTKSQVLKQLPKKIRTKHIVEMVPKQKTAYNELNDGLITRLDDGSILVAQNNLVAVSRLMQLSSSYAKIDRNESIYPADWTVTLCEPSPKVDALLDIIKDSTSNAIAVAAESRQLIELAAKRLTKEKISHALITGKVPDWERQKALKDFQEGRVRVILFTLKAGGTGLNMTAADMMVFMQRSWSMIDNMQGEDRVHRIGSERHDAIQYIDLVCKDTVEEKQIEKLYQKAHRLEEILRDNESRSQQELEEEYDKILSSNII